MGPVQLMSQRSTVDPSADAPKQARRISPPSRPSRYQGLPGPHKGHNAWSACGPAVESGRALLAVRGEAFPDVGAAEADEFQAKRRFEGGPEHAVPVVEAVLGPADRVLCALRQILGEVGCGGQDLVVVDAGGDQADALGLLAEQRLAGEQVV